MRHKKTREDRSLVRAHIAILLVFAILALVPFIPSEITGSTIIGANISESNTTETIAEITISEINISINVSNETIEVLNETIEINITNITETIQENVANETENISIAAPAENITNVTENISIENITINETPQNITNITETTLEINVTVENATIIEEKLIQYQAVINQPVKWKKTIRLENETANLEVDLPKGAKVLSVKEVENNVSVDITEDVIPSTNSITGLSFFLTGLAILEEPNSTSLIIDQSVQEVEIEYETEAPQVQEEYDNKIKRITVSSDTHYKNILTFTSINDTQQDKIRLYWIVNGSRVSHQIINYSDTNNNGLVDEVYWITPSLSNQTFEIIEVSRALHLDSNYNFISDVYPNVSVLDNVWTEPIYNNEYLRITFERNLTSNNDITVYARNTQNTSTKIEVYHFNSTTKIIEFPVINSTGYYKVLLTGMNGSTDIFDLKISDNNNNSYLEFDYIVDPGGATSCGDISTSTTLTTNVTDVGTCFNITADGVVLDCAGYGITYGTSFEGDGVTAIGRSSITVQNCFILDSSSTNARGVGVNFSSVTDSLIYNNTIDTNGTNNNHGIKLFSSSRNRVTNNTIRTLGSGTDNYGINIVSGSRDNNISGNTVYTNGSSENYGIRISTDSDRNVANENTIATTGTSNNNFGIYVVTRATFNNITNNVINTSGAAAGSGAGYGIYLQTSANNTLVLNNTVITGVRTNNPSNVGLRSVTKSFFNNFTHNRVNTSGTGSNHGVELANNADISVVEYNNISASGNANTNYGIVQTTSTGNNITNNNISTGRASQNEGIRLATDSNLTIIDRNNITTTGTGASNFGISLITRVARVNVTNNIINTSGTTTNHGINIDTNSRNNLVLNNTINFGGSSTGSSGILLTTGAFSNNITHNRITEKGGTSGNAGIELTTNANYSTIEYNNISTNGTTTTNYGITITSSTGNNITNNLISTNGSSSNEGIIITTNSNNTIVNSNNITTTGTGASNYGIDLASTAVTINLTNNIINTSGTATNYGIFLTTNSDNSTVDRNNITAGGSSTANHGIYLVLNSSNNNITNNVINASGSATVYGLAVENITEGNSMNRFDSNNISVSSAGSFAVFLRAANDTIFNNTYMRDVPNWTSSARGNNNNTFENTTFANINGTINFREAFQFNGTQDITLVLLNTSYNRSFVNSSSLTFLNTTATVRLYIPGLNDPRIFLDTEDDRTYRVCPSSRCTRIGYSAPVLTFNVTNWTSYAGADNRAPTITRVDINSTDPTTNSTNVNITIYPRNVTDPESDPVQNITNWFINGSTITVLHMPFETNTNGTANNATDYSGVGQNGTLGTEVRWINDANRVVKGGAYFFNGTASANNFINVSADSDLSFTSDSNFAITAWINVTDPRTTEDVSSGSIVVHRNNSNTDYYEFRFSQTFDRLDFIVAGNTSSGFVTVSTAISSIARNRTHFVVAMFESRNSSAENTSANMSIWVNGRTYTSGITAVNLSARNKNVYLGGNTFAASIFRGIIDEIIIFNKTLSAQQIVSLNNSRGIWETIVAEETGGVGENWSACVTPNDEINDGSAVCSANFTIIDAIRPSNVNLTMPPNNTLNRSTTWQFESNASDDVGLVNATLYHNISGSWLANQTNTVTGASGVVTSFNISLVADGGYIWNVQWCDAAGNCNQSNFNFTFTVDATVPAVNLSNPANATSNTSTSHVFLSNATDNYELANATLYHNINGTFAANETITRSGTDNSTNFTIINIPIGTYIWNVRWCDTSNNCAFASSNFTFTVESLPAGGGGTGTPASLPYRTQTIIIPKPKPVKLPEELEPPKELPPTPTPRFRLPQEVIVKTIDLQVPLKMRVIDWTMLLIILCILAAMLIRKELQYFREFRAETTKLRKEATIKGKFIFRDIETTLSRSVRILTISLESIFTAFRFAFYAFRRSRLKAMQLAALTKARYTRSLEKVKRKLINKVIAERKLLALERARRRRLARLHKIRAAHLEIRNRIESLKVRLLSTARLTASEMNLLEQSFRSALPMLPELMPHPELKEISAYENDATEFTFLYNKIDEYIKSNNLGKAKETYDALLSIYNKLLTETLNTHEIVSATKEIQSRLSLAILAVKAREKIEPYKPGKIKIEAETLPPETKYYYPALLTEEEMQMDYMHQLLKKNEYKKAIELFNSIYPEARKKPIAEPEKIKLPSVEKIKPHLHPKETPRQEEDLRFSYMRELLRKNEYKEALKLYEDIYKEKRELLKRPQKLADIHIEEVKLTKYPKEYESPTEEELIIDYIKRLLKKNEYRKALALYNHLYHEKRKSIVTPKPVYPIKTVDIKQIKYPEKNKMPTEEELSFDSLHQLLKKNDYKKALALYNQLYPEKRRPITTPKPIHGIKITEIESITYPEEETAIKEDQKFALMRNLLKKNDYKAAKKIYTKLFNMSPHKNDK